MTMVQLHLFQCKSANQQAGNDKGQQKVAARKEQGGLPYALTIALLEA
jgi:hypothetical protein